MFTDYFTLVRLHDYLFIIIIIIFQKNLQKDDIQSECKRLKILSHSKGHTFCTETNTKQTVWILSVSDVLIAAAKIKYEINLHRTKV